jgi:hypothetical protein
VFEPKVLATRYRDRKRHPRARRDRIEPPSLYCVLAVTLIGFVLGAAQSPLGQMTCFYGLQMPAAGLDAQC